MFWKKKYHRKENLRISEVKISIKWNLAKKQKFWSPILSCTLIKFFKFFQISGDKNKAKYKRRKDVTWNKRIEMRLQKWFGPIVINSMDETTSESSRVAFFLASADSLFCASHKIIVFFIHFFAQKNRNCTGLTKLLLQKSFFQTHWAGFTDVFFPKILWRLTKRV